MHARPEKVILEEGEEACFLTNTLRPEHAEARKR